MDLVWQNLRYLLIAIGVALAGRICNGCIGGPEIEQIAGLIITGLTWAWGIYVKWDTKTVPAATAARVDIPTVSAATGKREG